MANHELELKHLIIGLEKYKMLGSVNQHQSS